MNHACECGHQPAQHYAENGHCEADDDDDQECYCPMYQWQGDD